LIRLRIDRVVRDAVLASFATACVVALLGAAWLHATHVASDPPLVRFVAWTFLGGVATALLALLMSPTFRRAEANHRLASLGLPNILTLARFVLIAPTVVLLADARYPEALACYVVLFATDVADGIVARRCHLASEFGVVADPLADVASTFAIFTVFVRQGLCPPWLYALLCVRYAMLFGGSFGLFLATGPFRFNATAPGKIVGVVQAAAASLVIAGAIAGGLDGRTEGVLFTFLGIGFASIVISQVLMGWRLLRRR
jgi:cardiolipin synthase